MSAKRKNDPVDQESRLGAKSIYYEPQWNPYGEVPMKYREKYPQLYYSNKFKPNDTPVTRAEAELLQKIKLPEGDPPKFYKRDTQISYSNEEKLLVPTSLLKKMKR